MGVSESVDKLNHLVSDSEVLFAAIGGDIAYIDAFHTCYRRWDHWLSMWESLLTPSGFSIPLIMAIGNHEAGGYKMRKKDVPFFYDYFVHDKWDKSNGSSPRDTLSSYHSHTFGNNTIMLALDSEIVASAESQKPWIREVMEREKARKNRFAIYHVPMCKQKKPPKKNLNLTLSDPSIRPYDNTHCKAVRESWSPLFDEFNILVGFENHDHGYKRTKLIRNGSIVPDSGTLFMGDGAWGPSRAGQTPRWYIDNSRDSNFVLFVNTTVKETHIRAVNPEGDVFDEFVQRPF